MSGGGGGIIIIRTSIVLALGDPLVSGVLPHRLRERREVLCALDVNNWSERDDHDALFLFNYCATHG